MESSPLWLYDDGVKQNLNEARERAALAADVARARANIESQYEGMSFEDDGDKYGDDQYDYDQYDDDQYDDY